MFQNPNLYTAMSEMPTLQGGVSYDEPMGNGSTVTSLDQLLPNVLKGAVAYGTSPYQMPIDIGSASLGARAGFAFGGPWGAAAGGALGALGGSYIKEALPKRLTGTNIFTTLGDEDPDQYAYNPDFQVGDFKVPQGGRILDVLGGGIVGRSLGHLKQNPHLIPQPTDPNLMYSSLDNPYGQPPIKQAVDLSVSPGEQALGPNIPPQEWQSYAKERVGTGDISSVKTVSDLYRKPILDDLNKALVDESTPPGYQPVGTYGDYAQSRYGEVLGGRQERLLQELDPESGGFSPNLDDFSQQIINKANERTALTKQGFGNVYDRVYQGAEDITVPATQLQSTINNIKNQIKTGTNLPSVYDDVLSKINELEGNISEKGVNYKTLKGDTRVISDLKRKLSLSGDSSQANLLQQLKQAAKGTLYDLANKIDPTGQKAATLKRADLGYAKRFGDDGVIATKSGKLLEDLGANISSNKFDIKSADKTQLLENIQKLTKIYRNPKESKVFSKLTGVKPEQLGDIIEYNVLEKAKGPIGDRIRTDLPGVTEQKSYGSTKGIDTPTYRIGEIQTFLKANKSIAKADPQRYVLMKSYADTFERLQPYDDLYKNVVKGMEKGHFVVDASNLEQAIAGNKSMNGGKSIPTEAKRALRMLQQISEYANQQGWMQAAAKKVQGKIGL